MVVDADRRAPVPPGQFHLQRRPRDVVVRGRREGSVSMLAGRIPGLVGLIGRGIGTFPSISTGILVLVVFLVFAILFRLFSGPWERCGGFLATRAAQGIIFATSFLVIAAMKLPRVAAIAALFAVNVGFWYLVLLRHKRG
jgi:hypothetical protein